MANRIEWVLRNVLPYNIIFFFGGHISVNKYGRSSVKRKLFYLFLAGAVAGADVSALGR
mgnify:CR=1 FL=1